MKKLIGMLLTVFMLFTMMPQMAVFANDANVISEIAQYLVNSEDIVASSKYDHYGSFDVHVNTYVNGKTDNKTGAVLVYIMNHGMPVVGTESDGSILSDYLKTPNQYVVVTLDFKNNPKAVSPALDNVVANIIRTDIQANRKYMAGNSFVNETQYLVPQGCRLVRDIEFFDLLKNGAKGTAEAILASWNSNNANGFKNTYGSRIPACEGNNYQGGWFEATDISQLVKKDGTPIDTRLCLDIVYPSNPKEAPPVFLNSSSWERRSGSSTSAYEAGASFRGYATVTYDHEYYPMARDDHYGYYSGYGTAKQNGVKAHTAASRCVKYYAEDYGYDASRIVTSGMSKAAYTSLLTHKDPESLEELGDYSAYGYKKGENYGEQPFLTDRHGNKLTGWVQACFTGMGDGVKYHERLVNAETSPTVIACGYHDQFGAWDYWEAAQATYMKYDVPNLAITMMDLGHSMPYGIDPDLKYDRFEAVFDFFDYYMQPAAGGKPKLVYTSPYDGSTDYDGTKDIIVKFAAPIDESEIKSKVEITDTTTGEKLNGVWTKCAGDTEYHFKYDEFADKETYEINIPNTIKAKNGDTLAQTYTRTFTAKTGDVIYPSNDAYITNDSVNHGSENVINLSKGESIGYFDFDLSNASELKEAGELRLNVENDANQKLDIYALSDANWNEGTITGKNAPAINSDFSLDTSKAQKIATLNTGSAGLYKVDISEFISSFKGSKVTFIVDSQLAAGGKGLQLNFDDLSKITSQPTLDDSDLRKQSNVSSEWHYKFGGSGNSITLTSDEDHTTGSGKSILVGRKQAYSRIKFYNTFGPNELTSADVGKTYRISFWAKPAKDMTVQAGIMSPYNPSSMSSSPYYKYDTNLYGTYKDQFAKAGEWTKVSFDYTISQGNIDGHIGMLTIQTNYTAGDMYIDDIEVESLSKGAVITSKEGRNVSEGKIKPSLVIKNFELDPTKPVRIEKTQYSTLAEAIAAVPTDGTPTTIILDDDVSITSKLTIKANQNIVFDLNGKTVTVENSVGKTNPAIDVAGTASFENGKIYDQRLSSEGYDHYAIRVLNGGDVSALDGLEVETLQDSGAFSVGSSNSDVCYLTIYPGVKIKVAHYNAIYNWPKGVTKIYGGEIISTDNSQYKRIMRVAGTFEVYGGTFINENAKNVSLSKVYGGAYTSGKFYGGTFTTTSPNLTPASSDLTTIDNGDGTYSIVDKTYAHLSDIKSKTYTSEDSTKVIRFVAPIDSLEYKMVGFILVNSENQATIDTSYDWNTNTKIVYTDISVVDGDKTTSFNLSDFNGSPSYMFTTAIGNVPTDSAVSIKAFAIKTDGSIVFGRLVGPVK